MELTDELPAGRYIQEFVSSGPKSYAFEMDEGKEKTKFKGLTMSRLNSNFVNFNSIKDIIFEGREIKLPTYQLFVRDKIKGAIYNRPMRKIIKLSDFLRTGLL